MFGLQAGLSTLDGLKNSPSFSNSSAIVTSLNNIESKMDSADYFIFFAMIFMAIVLVITGYLIGSNPMFIIFFVLFAIFAIIISIMCANMWEAFKDNPSLGLIVTNHLRLTDAIISRFPLWVTIVTMIALFAAFAKPNNMGAYG